MRVLVAGGTGRLGLPVVKKLLSDGVPVRVLTRRGSPQFESAAPGAEIAIGDVTDEHSLASAVNGCDVLHISLRGANDPSSYAAVENRGLAALLACARDHGVRHVTYLSGAGRVQGSESLLPVATKIRAESLIKASGIPYTIFRATHFMESLDLFMRNGSATIIGHQPHRYHYLAASDFAAMVARALNQAPSAGRIVYAFGPEAYTMREALQQYMAVHYPRGRIQNLPLPVARIIARLTGNKDLRFATLLFAGFSAIGEDGDPREANELFGAPQTTLQSWLHQRAVA